jgi:membrane protease YdiL (CAAX protease family)
LLGIALVVVVGLGVGAVAAAIAISAGLPADRALALISNPDVSPLVKSPIWISASIALNELTLVLIMMIWRRRLRVPVRAIMPLRRFTIRAALGAVLLPFGVAPLAEVAAELVYRALPRGVTSEHVVVAVARGTSSDQLIVVLIAAALLPAMAEEAMFRGFLTTAFQRYSQLVALTLSSVMFGLFHLEPTQAAGTTILGIAFGLVRLYTGSIWPCMLSHFGYNAGVILEARWLGAADDHIIHWGRVWFGLLITVAAYALLVGDLWRRHLARLSFRPPAPGGR